MTVTSEKSRPSAVRGVFFPWEADRLDVLLRPCLLSLWGFIFSNAASKLSHWAQQSQAVYSNMDGCFHMSFSAYSLDWKKKKQQKKQSVTDVTLKLSLRPQAPDLTWVLSCRLLNHFTASLELQLNWKTQIIHRILHDHSKNSMWLFFNSHALSVSS